MRLSARQTVPMVRAATARTTVAPSAPARAGTGAGRILGSALLALLAGTVPAVGAAPLPARDAMGEG